MGAALQISPGQRISFPSVDAICAKALIDGSSVLGRSQPTAQSVDFASLERAYAERKARAKVETQTALSRASSHDPEITRSKRKLPETTQQHLATHRLATAVASKLQRFQFDDHQVKTLITTLFDALQFVRALPDETPLANIFVSEEAEISFQWRSSERRAIVDFTGDGRFGYALLIDGRFQPGSFEARGAADIPSDLIEYLRALHDGSK